LMLDSWVLRIEKSLVGHMLFLPQEVVQHEVWTVVLKEGTITNNNHNEERCSWLLTQMSGCSILLSCNMWFRVKEIKMEQGFL
jgi:hypothetical protein